MKEDLLVNIKINSLKGNKRSSVRVTRIEKEPSNYKELNAEIRLVSKKEGTQGQYPLDFL
jgi:hypothetical protein